MPGGKHILIVDDDSDIRETVNSILSRDGFRVSEAENGAQMQGVMTTESIDLVILDLMLPGEDGLSLARKLHEKSKIPFIMLTGKGDVIDKVVGLEVGADDYITKPFHARELVARVGSVLRRASISVDASSSPAGETPHGGFKTVQFDGWTFNLETGKLTSGEGEEVVLTTYEYHVLAVLASRPNRPLNRDQILDLVASKEWNPFDRSIDVLIGKIRKKLGDNPKNPKYIKTVRNLGYMFIGSGA